jgi:deazaflavin-dependent oxidoreductase (nitroreductase family)
MTMLKLARPFNRMVLLLAGTRFLPSYAVLLHRGRRSGKTFRTPVVVRPTRDGFVVPMPFGLTTDWYRNVRAAGTCLMRWKGREYSLIDPQPIDARTVSASFAPAERALMQRFGILTCLHLRLPAA